LVATTTIELRVPDLEMTRLGGSGDLGPFPNHQQLRPVVQLKSTVEEVPVLPKLPVLPRLSVASATTAWE
jgi:hypothetical protein